MGLSKTFSITGWRLGYAVAPPEMARGMWRGARNAVPWGGSFLLTSILVLGGVPKAYAIVGGALCGIALSMVLRTRNRHHA